MNKQWILYYVQLQNQLLLQHNDSVFQWNITNSQDNMIHSLSFKCNDQIYIINDYYTTYHGVIDCRRGFPREDHSWC